MARGSNANRETLAGTLVRLLGSADDAARAAGFFVNMAGDARDAIARTPGFIPSLVDLLGSDNAVVQFNAAATLAVLAEGSEDSRGPFCQRQALCNPSCSRCALMMQMCMMALSQW